MQSKIHIKLPQIKTETNLKKLTLNDYPNIEEDPLPKKKKIIKAKENKIIQSLNKLRLISLTPDVNQEKSDFKYKSSSPKLKRKLSNMTFQNKFERKKKMKNTFLSIKADETSQREDTSPVLTIPKNYYFMSINHILYDIPKRAKVIQSIESRKNLNYLNYYTNRSLIHYHKF